MTVSIVDDTDDDETDDEDDEDCIYGGGSGDGVDGWSYPLSSQWLRPSEGLIYSSSRRPCGRWPWMSTITARAIRSDGQALGYGGQGFASFVGLDAGCLPARPSTWPVPLTAKSSTTSRLQLPQDLAVLSGMSSLKAFRIIRITRPQGTHWWRDVECAESPKAA